MKALTLAEATAIMDNNGGNLDLCGTQITSLPENLTVGGLLDLCGTQITSLPDNLTVGGGLYLNNTLIASLPDNLTVGGSLYLCDTPITSLPENFTVGGSLYLNGTPIASLPENLTVGGKVYFTTGQIKYDNHRKLKDGEYVPNRYLYADGILTYVKGKKSIKGYDFYIGKIKGKNVVSDGTHYAHCSTLREGVADLLFKSAKDRGAKQYSHLTLDSEVTAEDAITMYRVITGACRQGTQRFVEGLGELKDKYTVREIINITQGQYNSEAFRKFFE